MTGPAAGSRIALMKDPDGPDQQPKVLTPHDLVIDPGDPSKAEAIISTISKLLLTGSAGGMLVATLTGMIGRGWPFWGSLRASIPFCLPFLMIGFLMLQISASMRQKRDDDCRQIAWEKHLELQKQRAEEEPAQEADDDDSVITMPPEVAPLPGEEDD